MQLSPFSVLLMPDIIIITIWALLKVIPTVKVTPTQIATERISKLMLLKLLLLLLKNTEVKLKEHPLMLLPWLPNINKHLTRTPPLEPSITTKRLPTMLSTTNGKSELTDPTTTLEDGLKSLNQHQWLQTQTERLSTPPSTKLLRLLPPRKAVKLKELLLMLLLWLLNINKHMIRTLLLELNMFMRMLKIMLFTINGK